MSVILHPHFVRIILLCTWLQLGSAAVVKSQSPKTNPAYVEQSREASDVLKLIASHGWLANAAMRVEYKYSYGVHHGEVASAEEIELAHRKRVIMERFSNGAIRELSYSVDDLGKRADYPFAEAHYDGKRLLWLEEGAASQGVVDLQLVLYPNPSISEAIGMRGDGILVHTGGAAIYTDEYPNLFELAQTAEIPQIQSSPSSIAVECKTNAGLIQIEADPVNGHLQRVVLTANQPSHQYHATAIHDSGIESVTQEFFDFEYADKSAENQSGLRRYKVLRTQSWKSGKHAQVVGEVTIVRFEQISDEPFSLDDKVRFENLPADGTEVGVINNVHLNYVVRDSRLEKVVERITESKLADIAFFPPNETDGSVATSIGLILVFIAIGAVTCFYVGRSWRKRCGSS